MLEGTLADLTSSMADLMEEIASINDQTTDALRKMIDEEERPREGS